MIWRFTPLIFASAIFGCAIQPQVVETTDLGCEARRGGELKSHREVSRLRCYLYYSDYSNAGHQIQVVENALANKKHEFDAFTRRLLAYYQSIYNQGMETARSNKDIDGEYWPIVKGNALYPYDAYENKVEGFVIVSVDISPEGAVENPEVLESQPIGVFEDSAVRAVLKNKYLPRIIDGKPLRVEGVELRLTYSIDD